MRGSFKACFWFLASYLPMSLGSPGRRNIVKIYRKWQVCFEKNAIYQSSWLSGMATTTATGVSEVILNYLTA
ncbi:hypothetical protein EGR_10890 [Echinococcus granulosus]|uniref:Secreted protein n=1 Tax=Echinococcus granulosus TaxID=6210 RepID=W6TZJ4_ECHGR|nr:hypothetical protein EGR_10890 [Echinococcus granulosus]EUB54250.1 hypothetical protein EGR_10890 [Echinococcus granulosus]